MDRAMVVPAATAKDVLQWSHGILAMDRSTLVKGLYAASTLQWSHGILAMDSGICGETSHD